MKVPFRVGILAIAGVLALSGCSSSPDSPDVPSVDLPNSDDGILTDIGGVQCVVVSGHRSSAVSCNWDAYNAENL